MSWNKKFTQGIIVLVCALTLACGAFAWSDAGTEEPVEAVAAGTHAKAGMIASLEETQNSVLDMAQVASASLEKAETDVVTLASKSEAQAAKADAGIAEDESKAADEETQTTDNESETADDETQEVAEEEGTAEEEKESEDQKEETGDEKQLSEIEKEWQDKVMADVADSLSIRKKGNADAEIVGKLYPTSVATVVKEGKTWTKIKSGSVTGYVKNKYLLYGMTAYQNAQSVCKTYAYVQTDGLRIRSKAKESAKVLSTADKGDKLLYNSKAKKVEGWVAVSVKEGKGYVSDEFVKVKLGTTKAVSIEEIEAQKAKEAAAKKSQNASASDVTLLAAIIQCEAGSECYQGKVAVGAVVMNRVRSSRYPNTISGVIYQRGQFSPASNGSLARVLASGNISSSCRQAAADALAGVDPTGGKLFFHRANGSSGIVIGNHVFY